MDLAPSSSAPGLQIHSTAAPPLRALLSNAVDYAGLFPPAELQLAAALKNHVDYVRSAEAWMLNSFVLPGAQFAAATALLSPFDTNNPLRISTLGAKTTDPLEFREKLDRTLDAVRELQSIKHPGVVVVQLEIALPSGCDLQLLGLLQRASDEFGLRVFCEGSAAQADHTIALLAQYNTTRHAPLGYKLRTGGVTADAFPTSNQIACALVAAVRDHVPIKFTAGLHHPVRQFRDEVKTKMHGFLNVFGAGVLAAEHAWDEAITAEMLADENPASFVFAQDHFAWRNWSVATESIRSHRELITSFGSCSFDEPRDDLRALHLL